MYFVWLSVLLLSLSVSVCVASSTSRSQSALQTPTAEGVAGQRLEHAAPAEPPVAQQRGQNSPVSTQLVPRHVLYILHSAHGRLVVVESVCPRPGDSQPVRYVLTPRAPWIGPWGTRHLLHLRPVVRGGINNSAIRIECEQCIFTVSVFSDHCVAEKSILPHAWDIT